MRYTALAGWYCCASEAGQSTEGESVLLHVRSCVTSPNKSSCTVYMADIVLEIGIDGHLYQCSSDQPSQNLASWCNEKSHS